MFRRCIEEKILDPDRVIQAGIRGSLYGEEDVQLPEEMGVLTIPWVELVAMEPEAYAARVRERVGDGPTFMTFDIDFVDPAFCPGTGTPEVGGPTTFQALEYVRALAGIEFVGFDVVEVAPQYDGPGQVTALFAANVLFEMLSLVALARRPARVG
jgi:agmatinase